MKPLLFALALLVAAPAGAQSGDDGLDMNGRPDASLSPEDAVARRFQADLADLARLASTAALVHERTGAFPDSPFALLGAPEARETHAPSFRLSSLDVSATATEMTMAYVPLPTAPYVREDLVVNATLRMTAPGSYTVTHEMKRREDADDGGETRLYARTRDFRVQRGVGDLCIETDQVRARIADGSFAPTPFDGDPYAVARRYRPDTFSAEPMTLRMHPPGEAEPALYDTTVGSTGAGR